MPSYRVWYRDIAEPLVFDAASRCSEMEILEHIFAHEHINSSTDLAAQARDPAQPAPTVQYLIASNHLAPVRYTEDESEINIIE
ncbi:hypothetical protein AB595_16290 [Massilia sp. WF1]|uniref:hypothetical protein n=1 Tax=unclassified Massilia TaxID=2609279 RepID=UPI00064AA060|nr:MULTISPECIES: hypothetical protein [unclassified Massilia]ALK97842.1 hypothetical protein AM586_18150 [Massilia sp. WG5]KLU35812.1 hypothetical protein AB595_16290 [Massilia sp. WF1]